jgi:hypothetical protein
VRSPRYVPQLQRSRQTARSARILVLDRTGCRHRALDARFQSRRLRQNEELQMPARRRVRPVRSRVAHLHRQQIGQCASGFRDTRRSSPAARSAGGRRAASPSAHAFTPARARRDEAAAEPYTIMPAQTTRASGTADRSELRVSRLWCVSRAAVRGCRAAWLATSTSRHSRRCGASCLPLHVA